FRSRRGGGGPRGPVRGADEPPARAPDGGVRPRGRAGGPQARYPEVRRRTEPVPAEPAPLGGALLRRRYAPRVAVRSGVHRPEDGGYLGSQLLWDDAAPEGGVARAQARLGRTRCG